MNRAVVWYVGQHDHAPVVAAVGADGSEQADRPILRMIRHGRPTVHTVGAFTPQRTTKRAAGTAA
jgi:hypothetical protein